MVLPEDSEHPFVSALLLGTPPPQPGMTGPSPAVRQCQLQLGLGQFELLLPDGVGQHLPVGVVGVGLCAQLKELPDGHAQGPAGAMAIRRGWHGRHGTAAQDLGVWDKGQLLSPHQLLRDAPPKGWQDVPPSQAQAHAQGS